MAKLLLGQLSLKRTLITMVFWGTLFFGTAFAATYYVDNSATSRCSNDPSYGSESNPWCTIAYGVGRMSGGDTLYVKSGTYAGTFTVSNVSGAPDKVATIQVYPGHNVTIEGSGVNTGRVKISGCHYLNFDGFAISNMNQGIFIENESSNIILRNCTVHNVGQEGIHVRQNSSYITIENCTIYDTRAWNYNGEGIYIGTGSAGPLDNTNNVTVRTCRIYSARDEAIDIKAGTYHITIDGNVIYNTGSGLSSTVGAIEITEAVHPGTYWNSNPEHIVKNNIICDLAGGCGIMAGTGSTIYNNLIYNVSSYGIYVKNNDGDSYARRIYHNTIDLPSERAVYRHAGSVDVRNNIGSSTEGNLQANREYFVSQEKGNEDYRLISGSAPIDAGEELSGIVGFDLDGNRRPHGSAPDLGAYEYIPVSNSPRPPRNVRIVGRRTD